MMEQQSKKNSPAFVFFLISVVFFVFVFGYTVGEYKVFPYQLLSFAAQGFKELKIQMLRFENLSSKSDKDLPSWMQHFDRPYLKAIHNTPGAYRGLNLVTRIARDFKLKAEILDMDGKIIHAWNIDWFDIWPDAKHVPERSLPKNRPGTQIHGTVIMKNGDLVFNFEHQGLVRLGLQGEVVWRLPYQTHHSIYLQDDGNLWVCGQKFIVEPEARFPNRIPPFYEYTILEVTPDGKIVNEWSVAELLKENGFIGLLYLGTLQNDSTEVIGDVLHLNDVEPFPATMKEGFFKKGDVLVSLRNINTIFVFSRKNRKIKFICTGLFVRQHDADFLDGDRISVFDNNFIAPKEQNPQSRIVIVSAPEKNVDVFFEGNEKVPFYTNLMGKHQWLPNGNLLITESCAGRAFEINKSKEVVWEYINYIYEGVTGLVTETQRLPLEAARLYTAK